MEIKKLIEIFKKCLVNYEKGYNEKYSLNQLIITRLSYGICKNCLHTTDEEIYDLFNIDGYYDKYIGQKAYLFPLLKSYKGLLPRINWLKEEIKDLNKLLKKGYTHV